MKHGKPDWKNNLAAFAAGLVFAAGLGISGMTQASKVIGFLNPGPNWDPSLLFVMMAAIGVHATLYHLWLKKRVRPLLTETFSIPTRKKIDVPLVLGAALFGVGWGAAGYCPGPAIMSVVQLERPILIFTLSMVGGMLAFKFYEKLRQRIAYQHVHAESHKPSGH